jgi:hypothetical protein
MDVVLFFDTFRMALLQVKVRVSGKPFGKVDQLTFKSKVRKYFVKFSLLFKHKILPCFNKKEERQSSLSSF